ncbi:MAG: acyltransferase [Lachnoclostridium sp.]|nr:acyltransferase [Lachnoclostridium sp.]
MVDQKFEFKRIFRLLGEVWFYTISIWGIYVIGKIVTGTFCFSLDFLVQTIKAFFPVICSHYWFVTAYVILMFVSPFFNKMILVIDKRTYQMLLTTLIIIFCVLDGGLPKVLKGMAEGRLIPVFIMYFIAGYIKKYVDKEKGNFKKHLLVAIVGYLLLYTTVVGIEVVGAMLKSENIMKAYYG